MEGIQRIDDTPQHKAVREAFTNAIIHSDFVMEAGILRIEKHDDKLVFRNPGLLRLPIEQIYEGGVSYARNPKIQNMLRMVGYGENIGSGFPMILNAWKQAGWSAPMLKNKLELDEVELALPIEKTEKSFQESSQKSTLKSTLKSTQKSIVEIIMRNPEVTIPQVANLLDLNPRGIAKHFKTLQDKGIIRRVGPDKGGHWEVVGEL